MVGTMDNLLVADLAGHLAETLVESTAALMVG
jgi:hypothetical protein